jgi:hypothetical protein
MKSFVRVSQGIRFAAVIGGLLALAPGIRAEEVTKVVSTPTVEAWTIHEPMVDRPLTEYRNIRFRPGDVVTISAGGCIQTGGHGKTWKRYVDPQGPNSDHLYHGLISIPGVTPGGDQGLMVRMQNIAPDFLGTGQYRGTVVISRSADPFNLFLRLGFEDDNYGDNGYWGRDGDDGTDDQCRGLPNAFVNVVIYHP